MLYGQYRNFAPLLCEKPAVAVSHGRFHHKQAPMMRRESDMLVWSELVLYRAACFHCSQLWQAWNIKNVDSGPDPSPEMARHSNVGPVFQKLT